MDWVATRKDQSTTTNSLVNSWFGMIGMKHYVATVPGWFVFVHDVSLGLDDIPMKPPIDSQQCGARPGETQTFKTQFVAVHDPTNLFTNVMIPNTFIGLTAFLVLPISGENLADRCSITLVALLTLVAFKFAVQEKLPNLPYLTFLDKYMMLNFFVIMAALLENFIVCLHDVSASTDRLVLWLIGVGYVGIQVVTALLVLRYRHRITGHISSMGMQRIDRTSRLWEPKPLVFDETII